MSPRRRGLSTAVLVTLGTLCTAPGSAAEQPVGLRLAEVRGLAPGTFLPELRLEQRPDFLPSSPTPDIAGEQGPEVGSLYERPEQWHLGAGDADWLASRFLPERPLSPALIRAESARGDLRQVGRVLLHDLARPYVNDGREALSDAFRNSPLTTGIAVSGAMALGVGAYLGLSNLQNGMLAGQKTFRAGEVRLGVTGEYDLRNGSWAGGVRFDLAGLFSKHERTPLPPSAMEDGEEGPRGLRLLARWLAGAPEEQEDSPEDGS